jgi:DNA-binding transcriptional ArsR family regulator
LTNSSIAIVQIALISTKQFDGSRIMPVISRPSGGAALLPEPELAAMDLVSVLQALADPVRLEIVRTLHAVQGAKACGTFDLPVGKSTLSHHFKVLREVGLIRQRVDGRRRLSELREDDLEQRFPGLLASVLAARP